MYSIRACILQYINILKYESFPTLFKKIEILFVLMTVEKFEHKTADTCEY